MKVIHRNSRAINELAYDETTRELLVTFTSGGTYLVPGVIKRVANAFQRSNSKGAFYDKNIRNNYRVYKQVN